VIRNTASRVELAIGPPVEQGSGAWAVPIGGADSSGDWPSGGGPGTRRTASGEPEEYIKVAVMDTRSGRSGGYNLKGSLECAFYTMPSSRGDARAAERARTEGTTTAPRRDQRISELDRCALRQILGDRLRRNADRAFAQIDR
jgi:hypothetical protein